MTKVSSEVFFICYDAYMELTIIGRDYLNKTALGYMVNTFLSSSSRQEIEKLQNKFATEFPDIIWSTPPETLHVTLMDWLAPLVDYTADKDVLFDDLFPVYDEALSRILKEGAPIHLVFNRLIVSPSAIAIVADENSTKIINDIRQHFLSEIKLLPNTKQPPNIVHCTIARFTGEVAVDDIGGIAESLAFLFDEVVDCFQLIRETQVPMKKYSIIKRYPLG
jgi:hypothetical protein